MKPDNNMNIQITQMKIKETKKIDFTFLNINLIYPNNMQLTNLQKRNKNPISLSLIISFLT